jgi:hypothetical protein
MTIITSTIMSTLSILYMSINESMVLLIRKRMRATSHWCFPFLLSEVGARMDLYVLGSPIETKSILNANFTFSTSLLQVLS